MTNRVLTLAAAAAVVLGLTVPAEAQTGTTTMPTFELGAGYQLFRTGEICTEGGVVTETCSPNRTFPLGFAVDAARNFGALGVVGEVGWSHDSDSDVGFNMYHFAAGLRWTSRSNPRIWPYGQVLAGALVNHVGSDLPNFDNTTTDFMVQPGGGVNFVAGDGWSFFGQVDYRRVFVGDLNLGTDALGDPISVTGAGRNDFRVLLGVRMILD